MSVSFYMVFFQFQRWVGLTVTENIPLTKCSLKQFETKFSVSNCTNNDLRFSVADLSRKHVVGIGQPS